MGQVGQPFTVGPDCWENVSAAQSTPKTAMTHHGRFGFGFGWAVGADMGSKGVDGGGDALQGLYQAGARAAEIQAYVVVVAKVAAA